MCDGSGRVGFVISGKIQCPWCGKSRDTGAKKMTTIPNHEGKR